jgi:hypothetical protein
MYPQIITSIGYAEISKIHPIKNSKNKESYRKISENSVRKYTTGCSKNIADIVKITY